jgi:hypothetical protein
MAQLAREEAPSGFEEVQPMAVAPRQHPLQRMFAGITEQAFLATLGVGDPPLIDYLSGVLSRFVHTDALYKLRGATGRRLEEVAEMLMAAEALPTGGKTRREVYRHIGDFTLFWTGVYPEALQRMQSKFTKDFFIDYCEQGKRSYYIASTFVEEPYQEEAPVLRRLSVEFELCAYGLRQVRREWEQQQPAAAEGVLRKLIH